jgi:phage-related protein
VVDSIASYLPTLIQNLLPTLIQATVNVLVSLVKALPSIIKVLADMLPIIIPAIINGTLEVVLALAEALPDMLPTIVDAILGIIPVLLDNMPLFLEAGGKLILGLGKGIINSIPSLLSRAWEVIVSLVNYFAQLPFKIKNIGIELITGLYNGIIEKWNGLKKKIENFGQGIINKFKSIFGIASPSREFYILGEYNMQGLENGMEDMQPEIQQTIDGMFDLSPNLTSSMNNVLSPNIMVNNYVTNETDPLGQVVTNIKTFSGGAKNDFNYGIGV